MLVLLSPRTRKEEIRSQDRAGNPVSDSHAEARRRGEVEVTRGESLRSENRVVPQEREPKPRQRAPLTSNIEHAERKK